VDMALGIFGKVEQRPGALEAELGFQAFRLGALAGAELAAVAPRSAVAEAMRVDEDDVYALLSKVVGGLQAGEAAADDGDVGIDGSVERGIFGAFPDACLIPGDAGGNRALPGHSTYSSSREDAAARRGAG